MLTNILKATRLAWPGPKISCAPGCWLLCREVDPVWLDIIDNLAWFWGMFDDRNGQRFLIMVIERSGRATLKLKDIGIGRDAYLGEVMRDLVSSNSERIEELSLRVDYEEECNEVMSRTFNRLRSFGAYHANGSDYWPSTSPLELKALDWLTRRREEFEELRLRRVLIPMELVRTAVNLRRLSVFGVGRDLAEDSGLRLDIAGLCLMGKSLLRLEEWEIGGEVELDNVSREKVVELRALRRFRLENVKARVVRVMMTALSFPAVQVLQIGGVGDEVETVDALTSVRDVIRAWRLGVGHMELGQEWVGDEARLQVDYEAGRCEMRWRAEGELGMVKAGALLVSCLGVANVVTLTLPSCPHTITGAKDEWTELCKVTGNMERVSVNYGGKVLEVIWDNLAHSLLEDTAKTGPEETLLWPKLDTLKIAGVLTGESVEKWLDWLDLRVMRGHGLENLDVLGSISGATASDTARISSPGWGMDPGYWSPAEWGVARDPVVKEAWEGRFRAVAKVSIWSTPPPRWQSQ